MTTKKKTFYRRIPDTITFFNDLKTVKEKTGLPLTILSNITGKLCIDSLLLYEAVKTNPNESVKDAITRQWGKEVTSVIENLCGVGDYTTRAPIDGYSLHPGLFVALYGGTWNIYHSLSGYLIAHDFESLEDARRTFHEIQKEYALNWNVPISEFTKDHYEVQTRLNNT